MISRAFKRSDHFVQFEMHSFGIPILGVLNQEYHEEGDDGGGGVDDQLPSVGKMKSRTGEEPDGDDKHSSSKCPGAAENHGGMARENAEGVADEAKEIALLFVFFSFFDLSLLHSLTLTSHPTRRTRAQDRESTLAFALNSGIDFPVS